MNLETRGICYISVDKKRKSNDIVLNILALVDKRVGKKRILSMSAKMKLKHPVVQYFYELRRDHCDVILGQKIS
ncbi:hypothetical protein [Paenibacillus riograndensis]